MQNMAPNVNFVNEQNQKQVLKPVSIKHLSESFF